MLTSSILFLLTFNLEMTGCGWYGSISYLSLLFLGFKIDNDPPSFCLLQKQEIILNTHQQINLFIGEGVRGGVLGVILEDWKTIPGSSFSGVFIATAKNFIFYCFPLGKDLE